MIRLYITYRFITSCAELNVHRCLEWKWTVMMQFALVVICVFITPTKNDKFSLSSKYTRDNRYILSENTCSSQIYVSANYRGLKWPFTKTNYVCSYFREID